MSAKTNHDSIVENCVEATKRQLESPTFVQELVDQFQGPCVAVIQAAGINPRKGPHRYPDDLLEKAVVIEMPVYHHTAFQKGNAFHEACKYVELAAETNAKRFEGRAWVATHCKQSFHRAILATLSFARFYTGVEFDPFCELLIDLG